MIEIVCWIEGVTPLLQNRATEEALLGGTRPNTVQKRDDPRDVAERGVYRPFSKSRQIAIPGAAIFRMIREAGSNHKAKGSRKSLKYLVPATVQLTEEFCPLFLVDRKTPIVDFEVDSRTAIIPATKGRVMRYRARFNEWSVRFFMSLNDKVMAESVVRDLVAEGTKQIGLGDFRPERGGPFGLGSVVAWDLASDRPSPTLAQKRNGKFPSASLD